jgi:hypothetical protein
MSAHDQVQAAPVHASTRRAASNFLERCKKVTGFAGPYGNNLG